MELETLKHGELTKFIILPYVKLSKNQKVFSTNISCDNPLCLSNNLVKSKLRKVVGGWKQQYQCKDCGCYKTPKELIKDEKGK